MTVLAVATCQFPVSADIGANLRYVKGQMTAAARRGARVAHFPEGALSGYAGTDFATFAGFDWNRLGEATAAVSQHARALGIWAVLASAHRLGGARKPHNSLYVIDEPRQIAERYDKRPGAVRLDRAVAGTRPGRRPAQRHPRRIRQFLICCRLAPRPGPTLIA